MEIQVVSVTPEQCIENGNTFLSLKQYNSALSAFQTAKKANPQDYRAWLGIARAKTQDFTSLYCDSQATGALVEAYRFATEEQRVELAATVERLCDGVPFDDVLTFGIIRGIVKHYCKKNPEVVICDSAKEIGKAAFSSAKFITSVKIPEGVTKIGKSAFSSCKELIHVELPNSLEEIAVFAFWLCEKLSEIQLPESLKKIGRSAFTKCQQIKSIKIPESVTEISDDAFSGWTQEQTIYISKEKANSFKKDYCNKNWNRNCDADIVYLGSDGKPEEKKQGFFGKLEGIFNKLVNKK